MPATYERRAEALRRVVALFALLLIAATWPLWSPWEKFPQVPLVPGNWLPGVWAQWVAGGLLVAALMTMLICRTGRIARGACALMAVGFAAAMLFDQGRMQPWAYQFMLFAVLLASCGPRSVVTLARVLVIAFYFESALTKLDESFLHTLGQQFLATLVGAVGASTEEWGPAVRLAAVAVFPVGELLVAVGLVFRATRTLALAAAVLLHALLLAILGPWGLAHQPGVLLWNAYFIVQDVVLFWPERDKAEAGATAVAPQRVPWPVLTLVLSVISLPLAEPWGLWDLWPSWGLYASSAERVSLQVHRVAREQLPAVLEPYVEAPRDEHDPWLNVRLDRWALDARRAPIYPQARVQLGIAIAVAEGAGLAERARFVRFGRADRWTGKREAAIYVGVPEAHAAAERYFFNALPRQPFRSE
jgi:hypothetical protein